MATMTRAQQREATAKQRQLRKYRERLQQEHRRAQRYLQALEQALVDLGLPVTLADLDTALAETFDEVFGEDIRPSEAA